VQPRRILGKARREARAAAAVVATEVDLLRSRRGRAALALVHDDAERRLLERRLAGLDAGARQEPGAAH
jgi:hypothetical protein